MKIIAHSIGALAALGMLATPAMAEKARDLRYIVGMKSSAADRALRKEGFRREETERYQNNFNRAYWWQDKGDNCVEVRVRRSNNRVTAVQDARKKDCGHSGGLSTGEAVAIGAGALIVGALVAGSRSKGDSQSAEPSSQGTGEVEFSDLTNAKASSADRALRERGFKNVDAFQSASSSYTIWWRGISGQCLQMTTTEGRVYDIRDIGQHPNCQ
ncbi:MAG: hypothetical protein HRT64_06130 [Erythrobacter sp.]|nr:hypothetical protein [Erythrobacter sp.]